jgi:lipoate-protein ligase A
MVFLPERKEDDRKNMSKTFKGPKEEREEDIKKDFKDRVSILAVAYHNLGVEQEFLKLYPEALASYR